MRKILLFLLTIILGCTINEWTTNEYPEFNFSVSTPSRPTETTQKLPPDELELEYHLFIYKSNDEGTKYTSYSVFFVDLKNNYNSADSSSIEEYFKRGYEEMIQKSPDSILVNKRIDVQGFPAGEIAMQFGGGDQIAVTRYILVKDKSYQLSMICPWTQKDNPDHSKFWDSFKLLNVDGTASR